MVECLEDIAKPRVCLELGATSRVQMVLVFRLWKYSIKIAIKIRIMFSYCSDVTDMQQWIGATNKAAALYSSPPLAAPIGSK